MISAKEANELVNASEYQINKILDKISDKIKELATVGKRSLNLTKEYPTMSIFEVNKAPYKKAILTEQQERIQAELTNNRFEFKILEETHDLTESYGYMPNSDESPKLVTQYSFEINW